MKHFTATTIALLLSAAALNGQELIKTVDAEREIQPELRAAERPEVYPEILRPQAKPSTLTPSLRLRDINTSPVASPFVMPSLLDTLYKPSPWRGYATASYFPAGDFTLGAGYKIIRSRNTNLDAWINGQHISYDAAHHLDDIKQNQSYDRGAIGLDFNTLLHPNTLLKASASLDGKRYNLPSGLNESHQGYTLAGLNASLASRGAGKIDYGFEVMLQHFGLTQMPVDKAIVDRLDNLPGHGLRNFNYAIALHGGWRPTTVTKWSLDIDWQGSRLGNTYSFEATDDHILALDQGAVTQGMFTIVPAVSFRGKASTGFIKVKCAIPSGRSAGSTFFTIDSRWDWSYRKYVTLSAFVLTGTRLNTLADMNTVAPYATVCNEAPSMRHADIGGAFTIGPLRGFTIGATLGLVGAKDCLMPAISDRGSFLIVAEESSSCLFTIDATYNVAPWLSVAVGNHTVFGGDATNYHWQDRARNVFKASVTGHPISRLSLTARYERRTGRRTLMARTISWEGDPSFYEYTPQGIGTVSNLTLEAQYQVNDRLGIHALFSGLTQGNYTLPSGAPGRHLNGLLGLTYRF